jgi:outer membrane protein
MRRVQSPLAGFCAFLILVTTAGAQAPSWSTGNGSWLTRPYQAREVAPANFANSNRLEALLRAGKLYLSLQDAIALALENNLDIALQRYGPVGAQANLLRAQAGGLLRGVPTAVQQGTTSALAQATGTQGGAASGGASVGGTASATGGAIITATGSAIPNLDPIVFAQGTWGHQTTPQSNSFNTGTSALVLSNKQTNFGVQQGFLSGSVVSLGFNNSALSTNAGRSDFNPSTSANVNLSFTQHLLQGFGLAVNNRNIRIAKNNQRVSDLAFNQQVMTTVAAIISGYWDLVSFNDNVKAKEQAVSTNEKLYNDNKKQVEIGTLAPIEIVRAEAELAASQQAFVQAQSQLLQQETLIKNALSKNGVASPSIADARIVPTDHITVPTDEPVIPVQDLIAQALDKRPELAQTRIQVDNTKLNLKGDRNALLPSLDLVANLQNNGLAGQINPLPIPGVAGSGIGSTQRDPRLIDQFFIGGYGRALSQIFARNFPNYSIGFQLNIPIRNRAAQADMILDQIALRQQEIRQQQLVNQVRVDVRNALTAVQQAGAAYQAAVKARILQEQTLDAEQKKYALGASTIFFVIQAQRDLTQALSNEVTAEAVYAKAKVQLDLAVGRTLEVNNISIDEAMVGQVKRPPSAPPVLP